MTQIPGLQRIYDQTVCNQLREAGHFPGWPVGHNAWTPWLSAASVVVLTEVEMDTCQVEDCCVLRWVSFSPVTCWWRHQRHCFGGCSVMVWAGIHHGSMMALVHVADSLMGIRYWDEILLQHIILHINVNCGIFSMTVPHGPDITVSCLLTRFKPSRISMGCTWSACALEESTTLDTSTTFYNTATWVAAQSTMCCATFDCLHASPLSSCH